MQSVRMPLLEALLAYDREVSCRVHVPAHNRGATLVASPWLQHLGALDVTEVPGLDDLFDPSGPIAESQQLAAEAWGAKHTIFSTCGTSAAVVAGILATRCGELIIPRNSHVSVVGAAIINGLYPWVVPVSVDEASGLVLGPEPEQLNGLLSEVPAKAPIVLINPGYDGISPLFPTGLGERMIIADEAHGAHLPFSTDLPSSLSTRGAEIVVSSLHKTGGALTQAALVRLHGDSIGPEEIRRWLRLVHTTSPSYPILASIDAARAWLVNRGGETISRSIEITSRLEQQLLSDVGAELPRRTLLAQRRIAGYDPLRIVFSLDGIDSRWLFHELRGRYGIQLEMEDGRNLVGVAGLETAEDLPERMVRALRDLLREAPSSVPSRVLAHRLLTQSLTMAPDMAASPRAAFMSPGTERPWERAQGEVSCELISVHPPGTCLVYPGQRLTEEVIERVTALRDAGMRFQGCYDPTLSTVRTLPGRSGSR